ncbi:acyl-CoA dehydrogenase, partial [bacterium]|nr:acyl-CoA dehydrogenase [bacterium]
MQSRSETVSRISGYPDFEDAAISLHYAPRMPAAMVRETREVVALARKFNDEVARPLSLEL